MALAECISLILLFLFLVFSINIPAVTADEDKLCDKGLKPIPGNLGYKLRGDRCEGLYEAYVSAENFEIISLLKGELHFDLQPGTRLEVSADDAKKIKEPIHLRARGVAPKTYYRMDADLPSDRPLIWPVDDVLLPAGLNANTIGIYGWISSGTDKTFVPLRVIQQAKNSGQQTDGVVELKIRSAADIKNLIWRTIREGELYPEPPKWQKIKRDFVFAGEVVNIHLPVDLTGIFYVQVTAKEWESNKWLSNPLQIRVIAKGKP